jgi:hypothetical protein
MNAKVDSACSKTLKTPRFYRNNHLNLQIQQFLTGFWANVQGKNQHFVEHLAYNIINEQNGTTNNEKINCKIYDKSMTNTEHLFIVLLNEFFKILSYYINVIIANAENTIHNDN